VTNVMWKDRHNRNLQYGLVDIASVISYDDPREVVILCRWGFAKGRGLEARSVVAKLILCLPVNQPFWAKLRTGHIHFRESV
jgi:hypothetical protein